MNIIELFEKAGIYKENLKEFTFEDTVKVKQQFEIERNVNSNLSNSVEADLILAMNEFPKELLFISNNRILYNFFSKKNYSRNRFSSDNAVSVGTDAVKAFIDKFLVTELDLFFDVNCTQNKFEQLDDLLIVKEYFPQNSLDKLSQKAIEKLDFILDKINTYFSVGGNDSSSIYFTKYRSFYSFISHFRSVEMDQKVKSISDKMNGPQINEIVKMMLLNDMTVAMANYQAIDPVLDRMLKARREKITVEEVDRGSAGRNSGMSTWSIVAIVIVVIRLILLMARLGRA
jgi:hypothetical protein